MSDRDAQTETFPLDRGVERLVPPLTPSRGPWCFHSFILPEGAPTSHVSWHPPREHDGVEDGVERTRANDIREAMDRGWCPDLHGHRDWLSAFKRDAYGRRIA